MVMCLVWQLRPEQEVQGYDTINRFFANPASSFAEEDVSKFSMACKAVTLLDRAHSLRQSWAVAGVFGVSTQMWMETVYLTNSVSPSPR